MTLLTIAAQAAKPTGACRMTPFRQFVWEKWQEHKDELLQWENRLPEYNEKYYFSKHRWFLKNIYREEQKEVDKDST